MRAWPSVVPIAMIGWLACAADAQRVSGIVRDSSAGSPVPGAVVRWFDAAGREIERTITGSDGHYRLQALPGGRELRVLRIGFRPRTIALVTPPRDTSIDVLLAELPTILDAVKVDDQPACRRRSDRAAALAVWDQARAALLATIVAREARPPSIIAIRYDRTLDRRGRIVRQRVFHDSLPTNQPFIAARPLAEFRDHGYSDGGAGQREYFAPDADVLLDPAFAEGHCFSLRHEDERHRGQIGLEFEPARDRPGIIDVNGVLWIELAPPALVTLEFTYTNAEPVVTSAHTGGVVSFRSALDGVTVIDRWNLHLPSIESAAAARRRVDGPTAGRAHVARDPSEPAWRVVEVHDVGAVIATAAWPDGSVWLAPLGTLRGRATRPDSASGVRDALVWLVGSDDSTRTGADGTFELTRLLPGPYPVFAAESPADRLAFQQNDSLRIEIDSSEMRPIRLVVPTLSQRIKTVCKDGGGVAGPGPILMLGRVLLPDGSHASGASVDARWMESASDAGNAFRVRAQTDTSGSFHVCGLLGEQVVKVSAELDSLDASATGQFRAHLDTVLFPATLRLSVPAFRSRTMRVVDDRGAPVRGAALLDDETGEVRAVTNAAGEASLGWVRRGRTDVPIECVGYRRAVVTITIAPEDTSTVIVAMRRGEP